MVLLVLRSLERHLHGDEEVVEEVAEEDRNLLKLCHPSYTWTKILSDALRVVAVCEDVGQIRHDRAVVGEEDVQHRLT